MQCPLCGMQTAPGDTFCGSCGANLGGTDLNVANVPVSPPPPPAQGEPITAQPVPPPPPLPTAPAAAATPPPPSLPAPVGAQAPAPPPFPSQPAAPAAKTSGLSAGAIVGIVIAAALVGVLLLGAAGLFAFGVFSAKKPVVTPVASGADVRPAPTPESATPATEQASSDATPPAATTDPGAYVVVTEAEARDVVTKFITLRAKKDIAGSEALCTAKMLAGPDGDFVKDQYWNPDSFKIVKVTPDQMYMHVASMGMWHSGEEPTIFQVFREPESGKVLIDGFIDPETSPDLYKP